MKKRNVLCYAATGMVTAANVMGCNPFLPGMIAIVGSEELSKPILSGILVAGCACFMPYLTGIKYLCIGLLILIGESLFRKMQGRLSVWLVAFLAAGVTLATGLAGEVVALSRYGVMSISLEAAFTFGMVLTFKRLLHRLLMEKQKLLKASEVPQEEKKIRLEGYAKAIHKMSETLNTNQLTYSAQKEGQTVTGVLAPMATSVVSKGLTAIATVIEQCSSEQIYECMGFQEEIGILECQLSEKGIKSWQYSFYKTQDGRGTLEFQAVSSEGGAMSVKQIGRIASSIFGIPLTPRKDGASFVGKVMQRVVLVELGSFQVRFHTARQGKNGNAVCGDNFTVIRQEDGKTVLALSDGMGSGQIACRRSETVLELLEELLEASFKPEDAIPMMNGCLSATCQEGFLATMDLCEIDEFSGVASFYKMGAPGSFLLRKKKVERIEGASLPAGAFAESMVVTKTRKLYDGDYLVMVSDGIINAMGRQEPEKVMEQILSTIPKGNPGAMALQILEIVKQAGGVLNDDCMVLVAGIFQR